MNTNTIGSVRILDRVDRVIDVEHDSQNNICLPRTQYEKIVQLTQFYMFLSFLYLF